MLSRFRWLSVLVAAAVAAAVAAPAQAHESHSGELVPQRAESTVLESADGSAALDGLRFDGLDSLAFSHDRYRYVLDAPAGVSETTVRASTAEPDATVEIVTLRPRQPAQAVLDADYYDADTNEAGHQIELAEDADTLVMVRVASGDGLSQSLYVALIAKPTDAASPTLSALSVTGASLDPQFTAGTFEYRASADPDVAEVTVDPDPRVASSEPVVVTVWSATPTAATIGLIVPAYISPGTIGWNVALGGPGSGTVIAVIVADSAGRINSYLVTVEQEQAEIEAPADLRPAAVTGVAAGPGDNAGELVVSWDAHPDGPPDPYRVVIAPVGGDYVGGEWGGGLGAATDNTFAYGTETVIEGLSPGVEYKVMVRARFARVKPNSEWSAEATGFAAELVRPAPVTGVAASPGDSAGDLVVSWDAHPDGPPDPYRIAIAPVDGDYVGGEWGGGLGASTQNTFAYGTETVIEGLSPGVEYKVIIRARFDGQQPNSEWSAEATGFAAELVRPAPVTGVAASPGDSAGELVVSWDAHPDGPPDPYRIAIAPVDGSFVGGEFGGGLGQDTDNTFAYGTSTTITGLTPGAEYKVIIRARFDGQQPNSQWSAEATGFAAELARPAAVTGVTAQPGDSAGELVVSWDAHPDDPSDEYLVAVAHVGGNYLDPDSAFRWSRSARNTFAGGTSVTVTGLTWGVEYKVMVRARFSDANSQWSSEWSQEVTGFTASSSAQRLAPSALTVAAAPGRVVLSWDEPELFADLVGGYRVLRRPAEAPRYVSCMFVCDGWTVLVSNTGSVDTAYVDHTANDAGVDYEYRVQALRNSKRGRPGGIDLPSLPSPPAYATGQPNTATFEGLQSQRSNHSDESEDDDAALSALSLTGIDIGAFTAATTSYTADVGHAVTSTTVAADPVDPDATVTISPPDSDTNTDGHQVDLAVGANTITVEVESSDNTRQQTYTVVVTRDDPDAARQHYDNDDVSTDTTEVTRVRTPLNEAYSLYSVPPPHLFDPENPYDRYTPLSGAPQHFSSNGYSRAWVIDENGKVSRFILPSTTPPVSSLIPTMRPLDGRVTLTADNDSPEGIWTRDSYMYVADSVDDKVYAYFPIDTVTATTTSSWVEARDITLDSDNDSPASITAVGNIHGNTESDTEPATCIPCGPMTDTPPIVAIGPPIGATMWVLDDTDNVIYAYGVGDDPNTMATETSYRDSGKDITLDSDNDSPEGIWSDSCTMWVADSTDDKIFAYRLYNAEGNFDPTRNAARDFDTLSGAGNHDPVGIWSDRESMWVVDAVDYTVYKYDMPETFFDRSAVQGGTCSNSYHQDD